MHLSNNTPKICGWTSLYIELLDIIVLDACK